MKLSIGDIIDRWSIAYLKCVRGGVDTRVEIDEYLKYIEENAYNETDINEAFNLLLDWNGNIWTLESDIRQGKENIIGLEEVGRRAIQIRDFNKERIRVKNQINLKYNEGFQEIKINHGSE